MPTPRFDKYDRLIKRLYEPLILLETLGKTRSERKSRPHDSRSQRGLRRQFLDDLAFLCELEKGGDACTAIGIEDQKSCFVYWVAANGNLTRKMVPFLQSTLNELKQILSVKESDRQRYEQDLIETCIGFAFKKVRDLKSLLKRSLKKCRDCLEKRDARRLDDEKLEFWFRRFDNTSTHIKLCTVAYDARKSRGMKYLEILSNDPRYQADSSAEASPFAMARHYIGRLADHIRVPKRLIAGLGDFDALLSSDFHVKPIPQARCVPPPQMDSHTTIQGICNRMFRNDNPDLVSTQNALEEMDQRHGILHGIEESYNDPKFKPRVHAEVQVLDFFYSKKIDWADGDRYIGCSKPACFCCEMYFRHHPLRPVERESHRKVYLKWGPRELPGGSKDPDWHSYVSLLTKVIDEIRKDALAQIEEKSGPRAFHPDSSTGITSTAATLGTWGTELRAVYPGGADDAVDDLTQAFGKFGIAAAANSDASWSGSETDVPRSVSASPRVSESPLSPASSFTGSSSSSQTQKALDAASEDSGSNEDSDEDSDDDDDTGGGAAL